MMRNIVYVGSLVVLGLVVIYGISLTNSDPTITKVVKEKATPEAYIKTDQPTAIYIEGNPEPILRIEDLPKEFPPHIKHPEGARFPDTKFNLASLSPDAQKIAFSCGAVHNWLGVYELETKEVHVITWMFETFVDQILWSSNSNYFAFTFCFPSEECQVKIVGFRYKTGEPYITSSWTSGIRNPVSIYDLRWSKDSEVLQFDIGKFGIKKIDQEQVRIVTLKAIDEEKAKETIKKETKEKTKYKDRR